MLLHSSWFDGLFLCPAAGLGERVPQAVPRRGRSRAGEAGQEGRSGVADPRDPANRLRTYSIRSFLPGILNNRLFCSDNRLYFSHHSLCLTLGFFCKAYCICSFIKDH